MTPDRVLAIATGVAAAGVCAFGGACGSSGGGESSSSAGPSVALDMKAGGNAYNVERCGVSHHYTTYKVGQRIEWGGQVAPPPSGRWTVKLKIKRCGGQSFVTAQQSHAAGQGHGYASGVVHGLSAGYYYGRLYYYRGNAASESDKEYFLLR